MAVETEGWFKDENSKEAEGQDVVGQAFDIREDVTLYTQD